GIFIERAAIHFPESWQLPLGDLEFRKCYIGSGGFTGEVQEEWPNPLTGTLFGLDFQLKSIDLGFRQNSLSRSVVEGIIHLPFFDQEVGVQITLNLDGTLSVALSAVQPSGVVSASGLITFVKPNLLELTLDSITFVVDDGLLTIKLAGQITPLAGGNLGLKWPTFDV